MPMEEGYYMGGAIYSASLIKAIDACTFQDNKGRHGDDIYSDGMATTVIRNSDFNTQETNNKARVVGPILACDSPFAFGICPETLKTCEDTAREKSSYGVKCGKACELGYYGVSGSCTPCSRGKYGIDYSVDQSEACQLCPEATMNPLPGQVGLESCLSCEEGKHATMGAPQCLQVCRRGQEQISNTTCSDCPPGKTSTDDKTPSCKSCPLGSIARKSGSPYCETCEAGKVSNYLRTECESCPKERNDPGIQNFATNARKVVFQIRLQAYTACRVMRGCIRVKIEPTASIAQRIPFHPRVMKVHPVRR